MNPWPLPCKGDVSYISPFRPVTARTNGPVHYLGNKATCFLPYHLVMRSSVTFGDHTWGWLFGSGQDPVTRNDNIDPRECNWVHNNIACDGNPRVEDTASLHSYPGFLPLK